MDSTYGYSNIQLINRIDRSIRKPVGTGIQRLSTAPSRNRSHSFRVPAKGCYSLTSDIDLALEGVNDELKAASIASELEELPLPYKFDVQVLSAIEFKPLLEHIKRVGIRAYSR